MWLTITLAILVALAAVLVAIEPFMIFGWPPATPAAPTGRHAAAGIANTNPWYAGRHTADPEAATVRLALAALVRPYATTGGAR